MLLKLEGMLTTCLNRSQCVIVESRAVQEVEGAMETVSDFVKTAPTFIAKAQVINSRFFCFVLSLTDEHFCFGVALEDQGGCVPQGNIFRCTGIQ